MELRGNPGLIDRHRETECATERSVPAFHAVVLLAGRASFRPSAGHREAPLLELNLDVLAAHTRDFGCEHVAVGRFV